MKKSYKIFPLFIFLLLYNSSSIEAQCAGTILHAYATVPAPGFSSTHTCLYANEYIQGSAFVPGETYSVASSISSDIFTVRIGAANGGTVIASGPSPLVWTAATTTTYYIACHANSSCSVQSTCRDVYLGSLGTACTNTSSGSTNSAPAPFNTLLLSSCQLAGEYATVTNVLAGNVYVSGSSVAGDYYSIRSGTSNGQLVAAGFSPLTWTAQIGGTYFVHVNSNSLCATQSTCRNNSLTCLGTATAPANDVCANAGTITVPGMSVGSTYFATTESPAPATCVTTLNQAGVWYRVVGNGNQFGADLCASGNWNSKLFVFSGSCNSLTCVTANDDNGPICAGASASATWCTMPFVDYYILVTGNNSPGIFSIVITQTLNTSAPTVSVTASSPSVCLGQSTTLNAFGASTYSWNTGSTSTGITVTPTTTSVFTVTGRNAIGCGYDVKTVTVTSLSNPTISILPSNATICSGDSVVITAGGANSYTFVGTSSVINSAGMATLSPLVNSTYIVTGTAINGCTNVASFPITVHPVPNLVVTGTNTFICAGGSATLTASGANTYTWTNGSHVTLQVFSPTLNTIYSVTGANSFGCMKTSTFAITVNTIVMTVSSNTAICIGNSVNLNAGGALNYTWTPVTSSVNNVNVTPTVTSNYTVVGKDSKNCLHSAIVTVSVNPNPVVSAFVSPSLICMGESATLTSTGAGTYLWSSATTTINSGSQIVVTPTQANTFNYFVTGTDANDCFATDSVMVKVEQCTGITSISKEIKGISVYPNPNNGSFKVELINGFKKSISVTDVSGRLLFTAESSEDVMDVNLNAFANGIYYVKVQSESTLEVIRVIKQ